MDNWEKSFLKFQANQDKEFLQKVQGLKVFSFNDPSPIAQFSVTGKQINIFNFFKNKNLKIPFKQSFSLYHGIYQIDLVSHSLYIGIMFFNKSVFMYTTSDFDDLFKNNPKPIILSE